MAATDSKPVFRQRATVVGVPEAVIDKLVGNGLDTLAKYAFSSSYVPGQADERPFLAAIRGALERDATVGELAPQHLLHEAYSMTGAELRQQVERQEDAPPKKLAQPERADRLTRQQAALSGIQIEGVLEPSDRLVDLLVAQYEDNRVAYVELSKCTSKEQEVLAPSAKEDRMLTVDSAGSVKVKGPQAKVEADLTSDLIIRYALTRRGLAAEQANIVGFKLHDKWVERLMKSRLEEPPVGYARISHEQIVNADRRLWQKVAELTRSGIQATAAGRPVDAIWDTACSHPDVLHLLQPLPAPPSSTASLFRDAPLRPGPYVIGAGKGKVDKGGKGKGTPRTFVMPSDLKHGVPNTTNGHRICFAFNRGNCANRTKSGRCQLGLHVCCMPKCHKNHPYMQCPKLKELQAPQE